jgi:hypothetical protein
LRAIGTAKNLRLGEIRDRKKYPKPKEDKPSLHKRKECSVIGPEKIE